jgi:NAD(P)-dependent dehydrogenase (short-subunit alcohol dehydrogenase family)
MPGRLHNKIAVITGSSSGIGRATALAFASEGASLICSDLHETARQEYATDTSHLTTVQAAQNLGAKALFVKCDTSSSTEVQALIQAAVKEYGRIDIMVNNAGIAMEAGEHGNRPVWEYEEAAFEKTMDVNIKGVFLGTKYASKQMVGQEPGAGGDRGWIINLSSVYGLRGGMYVCKLICFPYFFVFAFYVEG